MTFDGYREKEGQSHEKTLPVGNVTFTVLYLADGADSTECRYTVRYAAMDGTLLGEESGSARAGSKAGIPVREFDGYREIENQNHAVTVTSDGSVFYIKYEEQRPDRKSVV